MPVPFEVQDNDPSSYRGLTADADAAARRQTRIAARGGTQGCRGRRGLRECGAERPGDRSADRFLRLLLLRRGAGNHGAQSAAAGAARRNYRGALPGGQGDAAGCDARAAGDFHAAAAQRRTAAATVDRRGPAQHFDGTPGERASGGGGRNRCQARCRVEALATGGRGQRS